MKMLFFLVLAAGATGVMLIAQSKTELQKVWQLTEVTRTGENAGTNTHPQPGLIIFTEKFYSWIRVELGSTTSGDTGRFRQSQSSRSGGGVGAVHCEFRHLRDLRPDPDDSSYNRKRSCGHAQRQYGINRDRLICMLVENSIRETTYQSAAITLMNDGEHIGLAPNALNTPINRTKELLSQSDSAAFVPSVSFRDIQFSFWCNDQLSGHSGRGPGV